VPPLGSLVAWVLREVVRAWLALVASIIATASRHGHPLLLIGKGVNFRWLITLFKLVLLTSYMYVVEYVLLYYRTVPHCSKTLLIRSQFSKHC
jgi:hypothetical protein